MYRIIDKETKIFLRDDFSFDAKTEIGLDVKPAQGLYQPKWNGTEWVEGLTQEEIDERKAQAEPPEPTLEEKITEHDIKIVTLEQEIDTIFGG